LLFLGLESLDQLVELLLTLDFVVPFLFNVRQRVLQRLDGRVFGRNLFVVFGDQFVDLFLVRILQIIEFEVECIFLIQQQLLCLFQIRPFLFPQSDHSRMLLFEIRWSLESGWLRSVRR